jgi:hypothetical protein
MNGGNINEEFRADATKTRVILSGASNPLFRGSERGGCVTNAVFAPRRQMRRKCRESRFIQKIWRLFRSEGRDDFFEAWIAAKRIPVGQQF